MEIYYITRKQCKKKTLLKNDIWPMSTGYAQPVSYGFTRDGAAIVEKHVECQLCTGVDRDYALRMSLDQAKTLAKQLDNAIVNLEKAK